MTLQHSVKETETTTIQDGKTITKRSTKRQTNIPNWLLLAVPAVLAILVMGKSLPDEWVQFIISALARVIN